MCTRRNRSRTTSGPGRHRAGEGVAEEAVSRAGFSFCPGSWGEWHSSTNSNFRACLLTFRTILVLTRLFFQAIAHGKPSTGRSVSSPAFFICSHQALLQRHQCHGRSLHGVLHSGSTWSLRISGTLVLAHSSHPLRQVTTDKVATCHT